MLSASYQYFDDLKSYFAKFVLVSCVFAFAYPINACFAQSEESISKDYNSTSEKSHQESNKKYSKPKKLPGGPIKPSISGPFKKALLNKFYLTIGYNIPELLTVKNKSTGDLFTDLTKFENWKIGVGTRTTANLGFEIAYSSISRQYLTGHQENDDGELIEIFGKLNGKFVYLSANFYSPALDLKFVSLELTASIGMAIMFGVQHFELASSTEPDRIASAGPQLFAGVGLVLGFSKMVSIKGFVEVVTLNDFQEGSAPYGIPISMNSGISVNAYLL